MSLFAQLGLQTTMMYTLAVIVIGGSFVREPELVTTETRYTALLHTNVHKLGRAVDSIQERRTSEGTVSSERMTAIPASL